MFGRVSLAALAAFCVVSVQAGLTGDPDWPSDGGPLGPDELWENDAEFKPLKKPHEGPTWLWFFAQGKTGLDGRDGLVGDSGDKGDCGEKGFKGNRGPPGMRGDEGMPGQPGENGIDGAPGPKGFKGAMGLPGENATESGEPPVRLYTRWGREECPENATLVYSGRAGTSFPTNAGGGANFACLSDTFNFENYDVPDASRSTTFSTIVGVEYSLLAGDPLITSVNNNQNAPCAICSVESAAVYMQPGATSCPDGWDVQYEGYIMSERISTVPASRRSGNRFRSHFVCVDSQATAVVDMVNAIDASSSEATLAHVRVDCTADMGSAVLDCDPNLYGMGQLSCVVCSKSNED